MLFNLVEQGRSPQGIHPLANILCTLLLWETPGTALLTWPWPELGSLFFSQVFHSPKWILHSHWCEWQEFVSYSAWVLESKMCSSEKPASFLNCAPPPPLSLSGSLPPHLLDNVKHSSSLYQPTFFQLSCFFSVKTMLCERTHISCCHW